MRPLQTKITTAPDQENQDPLAGLRPPARRFRRSLEDMGDQLPEPEIKQHKSEPRRPSPEGQSLPARPTLAANLRRWIGGPARAKAAKAGAVTPIQGLTIDDTLSVQPPAPPPHLKPEPEAVAPRSMAPDAMPVGVTEPGPRPRATASAFSRRMKPCLDATLDAIDSLNPLILLGLFVTAVVMVMSNTPWQQNADDLLPAIISMQKLTLYYWEQNRFGNLLPLLTAWISNPSDNAYAQIILRVAAGLAAPIFFTALVFRRLTDIWRATLAADALLLLAGSPALIHETLIVATPYGTSLSCLGLAVLAIRQAWTMPGGWQRQVLVVCGVIGLLLAHIVNYGVSMIAVPVLGVFAVASPSAERMRLLLLTVGTAMIALLLPSMFAPQYPTALGLSISGTSLYLFMTEVIVCAGWWLLPAILIPVGLSLLASRQGAIPRSPAPLNLLMIACLTGCGVLFLLAASSEHVMQNSYSARYFVPAFVMLVSLGGVGLWQALRQSLPTRSVRDALFATIAALMILGSRGHLAAAGEAPTDIIGSGKAPLAHLVAGRYVAMSLDGIAGTYWDTWPAVFATEQYHHEIAWKGADVLGIAKRGGARRDAFLARLMARGKLHIGCIDLTPKNCLETVTSVMSVDDLRVQTFATSDPIGDGHILSYAEILPPR